MSRPQRSPLLPIGIVVVLGLLVIGAICVLVLLAALIPSTSTPGPSAGGPTVVTGSAGASGANIGHRTKTSGCVSRNALPDSACTPGAIISGATVKQICEPGYSKNVRNVTTAEKNEVYAEYGVVEHTAGEYEVDHLISLELGGSNEIANLWPEPAEPRPGFHEKDQAENYLHDQVCSGAISLSQAQAEISTDWLAIYRRMPKR